jgi:hypothetical protein
MFDYVTESLRKYQLDVLQLLPTKRKASILLGAWLMLLGVPNARSDERPFHIQHATSHQHRRLRPGAQRSGA